MSYIRKDAFYERAKREGFRSRAAYKLLEIQRKKRLLVLGQRVADLGCWPGGWLQVAAEAVGPRGHVVGVDLEPIEPLLGHRNVRTLVADITDPSLATRMCEVLQGRASVVLCDAAPKLTGVSTVDRVRQEALLEAIENVIPQILSIRGGLLVKLFESPESQAVTKRIRQRFVSVSGVSPRARRRGSSERYLLARGYRG